MFALDHHDGSCPYTEDRTGDKYWEFDTDAPPLSGDINKSYEDFHGKVVTRETEIRYLIDDLYHPAFSRKALKFSLEPTLDFDKLVVAGHSFGGAATLKVGQSDARVKCLLTMDPWMFPIHKQNFKYPKSMKVFLLNTFNFHDRMKNFPQKPSFDRMLHFLKTQNNDMDYVVLNNAEH